MTSSPGPSRTPVAIMVVLATLIHFPALQSQETRPYDVCRQSVNCGDVDLAYPFWGFGRPDYCGHRSFQLTCRSDVAELVFETVDYRVLDIQSSTHTVTIARNDLWENNCPQYFHNTSYNSTLFNGNNFDQEDVSLFYGCRENIPLPDQIPFANGLRFSCNVNNSETDSYFYRSSFINPGFGDRLVECNNSITVPVNRSTVTASVSDLRSALRGGFKLQWTANNEDCGGCVRSGGQCGSTSTSPDLFICYCASGNFSSTCNNFDETGEGTTENGGTTGTMRKSIIMGFSSSAFAIIVMSLVFYIHRKRSARQRPETTDDQIEIFIRDYGSFAPKRYKYSEIKKMTISFLEKLGQGGYGSVNKGQLPDGRLVAVKLLRRVTGDGEDFINEVARIGRTSHVNIVTLVGFCFNRKKRALLYEYMPNGSLDKFLRGAAGFHLDWNTLFQIAKGIARGLEYLHKGCNTRIVHFDIKPHNILLDEEFVPKISDFGLAKLCKKKESIVSVMGARGTAGYMAPEVFFKSLGGASHKSDVYSYEMMVLEMTGARKHDISSRTSTGEAYFPDWIYKQVEDGGNLRDYGVETEEEEELARKMMVVSLWCIQSNPSDRPSISKVVEMLEGSAESLQVRPRRFEPSSASPIQVNFPSSMHSSSGERVSTVQVNVCLPISLEAASEVA